MTNVPIQNLPVLNTPAGTEYLEISSPVPSLPGQYVSQKVLTQKVGNLMFNNLPVEMVSTIDGGGSVILAGVKDYPQIPYNGVITGVFLLANQIGSIQIDLWQCTYANFDAGITHPVITDSICGGNLPTITNGYKGSNTTLTSWTTSVGMSNILAIVVPAQATNITRVTVCIQISRNIP